MAATPSISSATCGRSQSGPFLIPPCMRIALGRLGMTSGSCGHLAQRDGAGRCGSSLQARRAGPHQHQVFFQQGAISVSAEGWALYSTTMSSRRWQRLLHGARQAFADGQAWPRACSLRKARSAAPSAPCATLGAGQWPRARPARRAPGPALRAPAPPGAGCRARAPAAACRPRWAPAPRPLRTSRFWRSSTSSRRTWRLRAGWAMSSTTAARVKLPSSATRTKYSSCLRSIPA
jgi:hypothetical protein